MGIPSRPRAVVRANRRRAWRVVRGLGVQARPLGRYADCGSAPPSLDGRQHSRRGCTRRADAASGHGRPRLRGAGPPRAREHCERRGSSSVAGRCCCPDDPSDPKVGKVHYLGAGRLGEGSGLSIAPGTQTSRTRSPSSSIIAIVDARRTSCSARPGSSPACVIRTSSSSTEPTSTMVESASGWSSSKGKLCARRWRTAPT